MDKKDLVEKWLEEEQVAYIKGWDFSHIHGRYEEENDLPWNYSEIIKKYLELDSIKGAEYFLTFKDIDEEDYDFGSELSFKAIHISDNEEKEIESELWVESL